MGTLPSNPFCPITRITAKFIALSQPMWDLIPTRQLLLEVATKMKLAEGRDKVAIKSTVFEDNNGSIAMAKAGKM